MNLSNDDFIEDRQFSRLLKLSIFLPIDILSIPLSICIICYLYGKNRRRHNISDDILIILIIISLIDVIFQNSGVLIYFGLSFVWPQSNVYCIIWNYLTYFDYYLNLYLTVWASIERHVLIFYFQWFDNKTKRLVFHRISLIIIILYGFLIYLYLIVFNSCQNQFDMLKPWCGGVCFLENRIEYLYHWLVNNVLPICLIILLNLILIIRIIQQKNRIKQNRLIWRKCLKLTIQMISISLLYLICFLPSGFIYVLKIFLNNPKFGENLLEICFQYIFLLANALLPFVTLTFLPDLRRKIRTFFKRIISILLRKRNIKIKPIVTQIHEVEQQ